MKKKESRCKTHTHTHTEGHPREVRSGEFIAKARDRMSYELWPLGAQCKVIVQRLKFEKSRKSTWYRSPRSHGSQGSRHGIEV